MSRTAWLINESEMDDFQIPILQRRLESSYVVKGCAGSGKTVLALWKARAIQEAGLGSFYFIVYTKALRQFINDGIKVSGLDSNSTMHFDQWKRQGCPQADFIIIDEAQDFTRNELNQLKTAAKRHFLVFGDSDQQVYKFLKDDLLLMEEIAVLFRYNMEQLVLNHRTPKKIARIAERVVESQDELERRCVREGASKPFYIKCYPGKSTLDAIQNIIEERSYTDCAILFPTNKQVKMADEYYISKGFRVESKYDISFPNDIKFNLNFHSENPKILTYHSSKGLQFEAVFIPYAEDDNIEVLNSQNPFYVALTRSYQDLFLTYSSRPASILQPVNSEFFELVDLTGSISNFNLDPDLKF